MERKKLEKVISVKDHLKNNNSDNDTFERYHFGTEHLKNRIMVKLKKAILKKGKDGKGQF